VGDIPYQMASLIR